jgi:nicotinamidase-related amidase
MPLFHGNPAARTLASAGDYTDRFDLSERKSAITAASNPTALIVVDVQRTLTDGEYGDPRPRNRDEMLSNIQSLLGKARDAGAQVVYVQHKEDGNPAMTPGHPGFDVEPSIGPQGGEPSFHKTVGNSFSNPDLEPLLRSRGITEVAIVGMQSENCVSDTTRGAIDLGFNVILPLDAHATYDWDGETSEEIISRVNQTLGVLKGSSNGVTTMPSGEVEFAHAAGASE